MSSLVCFALLVMQWSISYVLALKGPHMIDRMDIVGLLMLSIEAAGIQFFFLPTNKLYTEGRIELGN